MPRKKRYAQYVSLTHFPMEIQGLLRAFHAVFGLHNINNVLVDAYTGNMPRVIIRRYGRVSGAQLVALNAMVGVLEVGARTKGYLDIYLFGPAKPQDFIYDSQEAEVRFQAAEDVKPHLCGGGEPCPS